MRGDAIMKLGTLLNIFLLVVIAIGSFFWWNQGREDKLPAEPLFQGALITQPAPAPDPPEPPAVVRIHPVEPEPEPKPPIIPPSEPEPQEEMCLRKIMALQREIVVPHELKNCITRSGQEYKHVTIVRIEPDGINIRHDAGITKIPGQDMQPEWRKQYHIHPETAWEYRQLLQQRDERARLEAEHRHREAMEARAESLDDIQRRRQQREMELERQRQIRAWQRYDQDMRAYRRRMEEIRRAQRDARWRGVRWSGTVPIEPTHPPFPRPKGMPYR